MPSIFSQNVILPSGILLSGILQIVILLSSNLFIFDPRKNFCENRPKGTAL
jgi:hypothetical protein